ncbi:unnamed protein product [Polarella glacialis]|uniref:Uncharacterized protein n=1 Tax=Polarella glacialis TaxID=89957 RepID=A0A813GNM6_POLGL|nr:unnamed protein product [Polarella glacialis]
MKIGQHHTRFAGKPTVRGDAFIMPDVPNFTERHFGHFADHMGHLCRGQTLLYQYLGTSVIPCHEVLHLVQHLHGQLHDPDPRSYAMEHDASRLNYVLLWHVLERRRNKPGWTKWVIMLEGLNRTLWAQKKLHSTSIGLSACEAYRRWADSFGIISPCDTFAEAGDEQALQLESLVKSIVAGEALTVGTLPPSREHLMALLRTAFDPGRCGDVYSPENSSLTSSLLPEDLRLNSLAASELLRPATDPALAVALGAMLREVCNEL